MLLYLLFCAFITSIIPNNSLSTSGQPNKYIIGVIFFKVPFLFDQSQAVWKCSGLPLEFLLKSVTSQRQVTAGVSHAGVCLWKITASQCKSQQSFQQQKITQRIFSVKCKLQDTHNKNANYILSFQIGNQECQEIPLCIQTKKAGLEKSSRK